MANDETASNEATTEKILSVVSAQSSSVNKENTEENEKIEKQANEPKLNEQEEIERQEKLIRSIHGIPEPEIVPNLDEQPPTPEAKDEIDNEEEEKHVKMRAPRTVMVSNLSKKASEGQVSTLFGFIGEIQSIKTFPKPGVACLARVAFIQFKNGLDAGIAIHLTNTVFIDRPLIITIYQENKIPDENEGLKHITPLDANYTYGKTENADEGHGILKNENLAGRNDNALFAGHIDDSTSLDRSIHVSNLDEILVSEISLVQFLAIAGAVEKVKISNDEAFVIFKLQKAVEAAFKLNGATFLGKQLVIRSATERDALLKRVKETDKNDTMRRVLAAQTLIEDVVGAGTFQPLTKSENAVKKEKIKKERRERERNNSKSNSRDRDRSRHKRQKYKKEARDSSDRKRRRSKSNSRERSKSKKSKSKRKDR